MMNKSDLCFILSWGSVMPILCVIAGIVYSFMYNAFVWQYLVFCFLIGVATSAVMFITAFFIGRI